MRRAIIASFAGMLSVTSSLAWAADGTAAELYSYSLKDESQFEEGYRRHLGWHARQNDQLVWYGWIINSGPRKGFFVDGTFGTTFSGLDAWPDSAGDGADFRRNVAPFVTALAEIEVAGPTLLEMLTKTYASTPVQAFGALAPTLSSRHCDPAIEHNG